jgi:hypothetical protein
MDASLNPQSIFEPNNASNFGVKFRLPVESSGTPDITISPSYIANIINNPVISNDTWTGTIQRSQNKNLLYNIIDFSYNGFDTSLNFNVAQNPELIVGPREIGDFVECKGIKITSVSSTEAFTVTEVQITDYDTNTLISNALYESSQQPQSGTPSSIMDNDSGTSCTLDASSNSFFNIKFTPTATPIKIKEITIYASHSVKIELLNQTQSGVYETITNLGQVNVDVSGTINIANESRQSTITRAVTNIALDPSNIVYPDVSSNFEMLFSTNTVSLSDISNIYLSIDPSNVANLTNLSLTEDGFKLEGQIEANEKIFEEVCKLKYDEPIDISGEKQLAIKDLFISSSSIVPKTAGVSAINFEHNIGELELVFTLEKSDLSLNDFVLDNSAVISNLIKDGLKWKADITFPNTSNNDIVVYSISVNYKPGDSYPISKTYNTYVPIVGNEVSVLDIYDKVPDPVAGVFDISINDNTILTSGNPSDQRAKREVFIERLLDTYKDNLKTTTDKLVMKTEELLGANSGITKEKIKIIDNFDTNGNKLTDISFNTNTLSGDEAVYVPLDVGYSIILDTYSSKLKVEKVSDTSFNVYENYDDSNPNITKVMTYDETGIYDFFQYKIGTVEGENLPAITDISLNPSNIITDLSSNLQVTFSQPAIEPIITIDPSYIAYLDGSMTMVDSSGYIWSGTINRTLEMNRLNNILTVSGEQHTSNISFNVLEDTSLHIEWVIGNYLTNAQNDWSSYMARDGKTYVSSKFTVNTVYVYKYFNYSWNNVYNIIVNNYTYDYFGRSVALSDDGTRLVVGAPFNNHDVTKDHVYTYTLGLSTYSLVRSYSLDNTFSSNIDQYTMMGKYVSISGDGNIIYFSNNRVYRYSSHGKIYKCQWNSDETSITLQNPSYNNGPNYWNSPSMSANNIGTSINGDTFIVGNNSIFTKLNTSGSDIRYYGIVLIYKNDIRKESLYSMSSSESYGSHVSCSPDSSRVAFASNTRIHICELNTNGNIIATNHINLTNLQSIIFSNDSNSLYITNGSNYYTYTFNGSSWVQNLIIPYTNVRFFYKTDDDKTFMFQNTTNIELKTYENIIKRQLTSTTLTPSDILYPYTSSNFELLFTTNEKTLDDISGNLQLDPSGVGNLTNLQLAHSGFKLVGNIEAPNLKKNKDTKLKYFETVDVSGESNPFTVYTYPPFQLVNFGLTPENIVGPNDVSSNLQIEFNIPISSDTSLNNSITIDPSYIVNLDTMTTSDGYTWSGTLTREPHMNKLGNKLEFNYTDNSLSDLNDNAFTASAELVFDVLESKNVLKWEKKTDTSLNETFNETVEISPNGQILAQISGSNAKIYHLQSDSTWSLEEEISGNHLALCDNRIAIATSAGVDVYEYDSSWSQIGSIISALNVSNLDISIDGNRVAYVSDVSSVGIQEYSSDSGSWSSMSIAVPITGNSVKISPNGLLLGIGTLDSENQNFSNVVLYEYSEGSGWNLKS